MKDLHPVPGGLRRRRFGSSHESLRRIARQAPEPHRVAAFWALAVGAELRQRTRATLDEEGRVLIEVLDSTWSPALREMGPDLLQGLNDVAKPVRYRAIRFLDPSGPADGGGCVR